MIKAHYFRMLRRKVSYVFLAAIPSTVEKAREALKKSGRKKSIFIGFRFSSVIEARSFNPCTIICAKI